ncbi:hypothetical protein BC833DRAFT_608363 [Globomyces pollinis-pini]|nr:hypothetical protein BC833DRAFT_608363 [Globomyces pollinis-pini]
MVDLAFNTIAHSTNENIKIWQFIYGMNFEYFPELKFEWGVFVSYILVNDGPMTKLNMNIRIVY